MMRSELNFPFSFKRVWYIIRQAFGATAQPPSPAVGMPTDSMIPPEPFQPEESTTMQHAKLSHAQATTLRLARAHTDDKNRKAIKKEIYSAVKEAFGIPQSTKIGAEVDPARPNYAKLYDAKTRANFTLNAETGRWDGADDVARVQVPSSWFVLPADKLKQALIDAIESALDGDAERYNTEELDDLGAKKIKDGGLDVALDDNGNAYVFLPNDHFVD